MAVLMWIDRTRVRDVGHTAPRQNSLEARGPLARRHHVARRRKGPDWTGAHPPFVRREASDCGLAPRPRRLGLDLDVPLLHQLHDADDRAGVHFGARQQIGVAPMIGQHGLATLFDLDAAHH
jgi:hypothetical protein